VRERRLPGVPALVDVYVLIFDPAQTLETLHEGLHVGLRGAIGRNTVHEHADAPDPLRRLSARFDD
jgi:hypothetical protein